MNLGTAHVIQGDARRLPLEDESVDVIITSPPYFALRSYQDGGEHYDGQIGSEPTPQEFVDALIVVTRECMRVLKPAGTMWVNLGDKYVADNRGSGPDPARGRAKHAPVGPAGYPTGGMPHKSLMGLPWRYALRCIDELGLVLRQEVIWDKPNGTPESVVDRPRRSHEQWFMLTKQARYFSAIDEVREPFKPASLKRIAAGFNPTGRDSVATSHNGVFTTRATGAHVDGYEPNPLGKLPGSVRTVPSEPLLIPEAVEHAKCCGGRARRDGAGKIICEDGIDHFAAFPSEWPRWILQGFGPTHGVCVRCGEGRRPLADVEYDTQGRTTNGPQSLARRHESIGTSVRAVSIRTITDYVCACNEPIVTPTGIDAGAKDSSKTTGRAGFNRPRDGRGDKRIISRYVQQHEAKQIQQADPVVRQRMADEAGPALAHYMRLDRAGARAIPEPLRASWRARGWLVDPPAYMPPATRPGVVLDPFGGTGTTAMVAKALGMVGISVDLSADYCHLARWRTNDRDQLAKVLGIGKAPPAGGHEHEDDLFTLIDD